MGSFIFYLHYTLLTSGLSGTSVLLGVIIKEYSDATSGEIGLLLMSFPFVSIIIKPLFCSIADRYQAHRMALILALLTLLVGYTPFIVIPFFPDFYQVFPRLTWYLLALSCLVGNAGLGIAWCLGDTLAVNISQKTGTPYGRMRLMGTVSWGVYGYIIGEINETPWLPKFVPGFAILHLSVIIEIIILLFWNKEDFEMYDPAETEFKALERAREEEIAKRKGTSLSTPGLADEYVAASLAAAAIGKENYIDSAPSSLGGTLRCHKNTAFVLKNLVMAEELRARLQDAATETVNPNSGAASDQSPIVKTNSFNYAKTGGAPIEDAQEKLEEKNIQVLVLKMLLKEDGRLIKYLILFMVLGFFMSPMNFVFLSLTDVCKERDCNFSKLAGTLLISQAVIETVIFLVVPWFLIRIRRSTALAFCFVVFTVRYVFYTVFYSMPNIPPYFAIVGESGHGLAYGVFCTVMAETSLMFANQTKLFIPELRRMGIVSQRKEGANNLAVETQENKIRMALRATMQSLFSGVCDGLGVGTGSLLCGFFVETFTYINLWQLLSTLAFSVLILQQVIEFSHCKWSDTYKAEPGTKAYLILTQEREQRELEAKLRRENKSSVVMGHA